jgi:hypothetical protein
MIVNLAAVSHLIMLMAVSAGLWLEGSLDMGNACAKFLQHVLEHMILGDAQEAISDLHRHVPVAEVVGDPRQRSVSTCSSFSGAQTT